MVQACGRAVRGISLLLVAAKKQVLRFAQDDKLNWQFVDKKAGALWARPEFRRTALGKCLASAKSGRLHGLAGNVCGGGDALHTQLEVVGVGGVFERGFVADQPGLEQIPERLVEGLHAVLRGSGRDGVADRSEEHTSELQSQFHLVCRLLLEKKKKIEKV